MGPAFETVTVYVTVAPTCAAALPLAVTDRSLGISTTVLPLALLLADVASSCAPLIAAVTANVPVLPGVACTVIGDESPVPKTSIEH